MVRILSDWLFRTNKSERLWLLAKIEFKLRYYENRLGLLWALIKPIMEIIVYYIVFGVVMKTDIPAFASFLFIGLIIWNFFVESTSGTIQILKVKKYLYEYSNMNKLEIYASTLLANSIGLFFNFGMFVVFYFFIEKDSIWFNWNNLWIIPLYINLFIISLGMSMILSNLYIVAKDIAQIWQVMITFLFFLSPILYKLSIFKAALPSFEYINPVAGIVVNARYVLMEARGPDMSLLLWDIGYGIMLLLAGLIILNKLGSRAAEKL